LGHFGGIPDKLTFSAGFVTAQLALLVDWEAEPVSELF
jgi:hypothetical protein